jgi:hypothetical protein
LQDDGLSRYTSAILEWKPASGQGEGPNLDRNSQVEEYAMNLSNAALPYEIALRASIGRPPPNFQRNASPVVTAMPRPGHRSLTVVP